MKKVVRMKRLILIITVLCVTSSFSPKRITWVAIGDSITYLNDHPNETGNRITKGYMTRVAEKLPNVTFVNQGHNGWTSGGIAKEIETLGLVKADVYSIFLGTNDWWSGRPLGTIANYNNNSGNNTMFGSFKIIINKLRSLNPAARIFLITPMQRADFIHITNMKNNAYGSYKEKNGQSLSQFAQAIIEIAKAENIEVVDLYNKRALGLKKLIKFKRLKDPVTGEYKNFTYPAFVHVPFNPEKDEYPYPLEAIDITYDGLHPSDKGFEIIADMIVKTMKEYFTF